MGRETEIKLVIDNRKAFERKLKKLGAKTTGPGNGQVHELNTIFDTPDGGLAKHGQLLRIRTETCRAEKKRRAGKNSASERVLLTFKQPAVRGVDDQGARYKVRDETEVEVADGSALKKIFEGLGLRGWFSYEKYRTTWRLRSAAWAHGLLIEIDETPIGTYVELEGPEAAIDRTAKALGYSRRDYLLKNYLALYAEACRRKGVPPGDMLFEKPNTR